MTTTLDEISESISYGVTASASKTPVGPKFLRITDIQDGTVEWEKVPWCECSDKELTKGKLVHGDIVFARTGATTGKSYLISDCPDESVFASYLIRLRLKKEANPEFVSHFFQTQNYWDQITKSARGAAQPGVNATTLKRLKIPLPPLAEQKRLAAILDAADALRAKRQEALAHLDDLLQSTFLNLFGDPVTNPMGWDIDSLANHGSFKNGLNYGKSEQGIEIRCLGVGNFKSHSRLSDVTGLPFLNLDSMPSNGYLLEEGDIVFVRSNGNKALVGRCLSIHPDGNQVTFSGFCIRYRVEDSKWLPTYLSHLFRTDSLRAAMLQGGQGANIQNINQKILSSLPIPLPPLPLQRRFAAIVEKIETQKARHRAHLAELDTLFAALQARAFNGELTMDNG